DLEVAWRFKTDSLGCRPEFKLEGTPIAVNGILYATAGTRRSVIALDGATGELIWVHRYPEGTRGANAPRQLSGRGLAYWSDGRGDERIIYVTPGYRMIALDARTGVPVKTFGKDGIVDLKVGVVYGEGKPIDLETGALVLVSRPTVVGTPILVGSAMKEGMTVRTSNNSKGLARAFDARTGKLIWTFHTIPRPGEEGNDTWLNNSWAINGNTGVWTQISVDEELGLVYLPVESPTSDYYGGKRPGNNLYGESLVCVDLATGKKKWHFQFVHHPIWDHDMSSAPLIADVTVAGRARKVVAVPSKQAWLWVFDRVTGEPIWPIEEKPGPKGGVAGERGKAGAERRRAGRMVFADAAASARGADVRAQLGALPGRSDRLHAGAAGAGREADPALPLRQRRRLHAADGRRRQRAARRDHDGRGQRRHQLAGRRLQPRDAHRLRDGRDGDHCRRIGRAAAAGGHRHRVSRGCRRPGVPRAARGRHRHVCRRAAAARPGRQPGTRRGWPRRHAAGRADDSRAGSRCRTAGADGGSRPRRRTRWRWRRRGRRPHRAGALDPEAALWRTRRDGSRQGSDQVARGARRDARRGAQSSAAQGDEHPAHRPERQRRAGHHQDAGRARRLAVHHHRPAPARRDAPRLRSGDRQGSGRGLHSRAAERLADDLHGQRAPAHRGGGERRPLFRRIHCLRAPERRGRVVRRAAVTEARVSGRWHERSFFWESSADRSSSGARRARRTSGPYGRASTPRRRPNAARRSISSAASAATGRCCRAAPTAPAR